MININGCLTEMKPKKSHEQSVKRGCLDIPTNSKTSIMINVALLASYRGNVIVRA